MIAPVMAQSPAAEATDISAETLFGLRHVVRNVPERALAPTGRPGGFAGRRRGNGLEIVDVRPFSDGDDPRHIDAAATARTARTHVRTFRDERDRAALLIADFRQDMLFGTRRRLRSVAAAGALALAGWRVVEAGGRVGLMTLATGEPDYLPPRSRERAMAAAASVLERAHRAALANARKGDGEPLLEEVLDQAIARSSGGTTLVLASALDHAGADFDRLAAAAARRFRLVVLLIRDRFETEAPRGAYPYRVSIGGKGGEAVNAGLGDGLRWAFRARSEPQGLPRDDRLERLAQLGVDVRPIAADADWTDIARQLEGSDAGRA